MDEEIALGLRIEISPDTSEEDLEQLVREDEAKTSQKKSSNPGKSNGNASPPQQPAKSFGDRFNHQRSAESASQKNKPDRTQQRGSTYTSLGLDPLDEDESHEHEPSAPSHAANSPTRAFLLNACSGCSCGQCLVNALWTNFDFLTSSYLNLGFCALPFSFLAAFFRWPPIVTFLIALASLMPCLWQVHWLCGQLQAAFVRLGRFPIIPFVLTGFFSNLSTFLCGIFYLCISQNENVIHAYVSGTHALYFLLALAICFIINAVRTPTPKPNADKIEINEGAPLPDDIPENEGSGFPVQPKKFKYSIQFLSNLTFLSVALLCIGAFFDTPSEGHGVLMLSRWLSLPALAAGICVHVFRYQRSRDQSFFEKSNYSDGEKLGLIVSVFGLVLSTAMIAFESYLLSISALDVSVQWGLSESFLGGVLLPLVSLLPCLVLLYRHTMRGSLQAAIEMVHLWSLDLMLIVMPLWCLLSWLFNGIMLVVERNQKEKDAIAKGQTMKLIEVSSLSLRFPAYHVTVLLLAVLSHKFLVMQGRPKNWLIGAMMLLLYVGIAIGFFFHP